MAADDTSPTDSAAPARDRGRDRPATELRILAAAETILQDQGSSGFGVNAVARAAGVDKQLIYRYFGGMDGLMAALGERLARWWQDRLMVGAAALPPAEYADLIEMLALRLAQILRTEPLARHCALWELSDASGPVAALAAARSQALAAWMARTRGSLQPPPGVDAPAINALIVAGVSYMVLAGRTSASVVGLATDDAATWPRIDTAIRVLVQGAYRAA